MAKLELLAPAGDMTSFKLAINNGADAVYIAGKNFGARAYATNFTTEELIEAIQYAHIRGKKVYVTVNTIIKNNELSSCVDFVGELYKGGVDAIIIQDLGLASILKQVYPDLVLHASTQMNCLNVNHAKDLKEFGFKRIILARETPIEVVKEIIDEVDIEVEVFAHGALCMCYSGNCYLSSVIGKRSGNRGRCAQPCRLQYELVKDDQNHKGQKRYYLSPRDLCEIDNLDMLASIGVTSIKLEGRMRKPEYVGLITNRYRKAIDNLLDEDKLADYKKDLAVMFNRSFTKGYLFNENNKHFTNVATSNHIGIKVGKVTKYNNGYAYIKLDDSVRNGDGLRILNKDNDAVIINEMFVNGIKGSFAKAGDLIQIKVHKVAEVGANVLKTSDARLEEEVINFKEEKIFLDARLYVDEVACLEITDGNNKVTVKSTYPFEVAKNIDIKLRQEEQLRKTSDSIYEFRNIEIASLVFLPIKEINELRRKAIDALNNIRKGNKDVRVNKFIPSTKEVYNDLKKHLFFKVISLNQLEACINQGAKDILVDDKNLYEAANKYKLLDEDLNIILVDKRINNNGIYNKKVVNVYSNIINYASVRNMLENGCEIVGMSIEASKDDIKSTIDTYKAVYGNIPNIMVMVYGYYELMVMKHCLINKALGYDKLGCGACKDNDYYLMDRLGYKFPLVNDGACHLKLLNSKRLHLVNYVDELLKMGVNNLLVDLSIENDAEEIIEEYIDAFNASLNNDKYIEEYDLEDVTYGHYKEGIE